MVATEQAGQAAKQNESGLRSSVPNASVATFVDSAAPDYWTLQSRIREAIKESL